MIDKDFEDGENHGPSLRSNHLEDVFFGMRCARSVVFEAQSYEEWFLWRWSGAGINGEMLTLSNGGSHK